MRNHTVLPATHTFIHKWNEPYLPPFLSRGASPHFGRYSFTVQLKATVLLSSRLHHCSIYKIRQLL